MGHSHPLHHPYNMECTPPVMVKYENILIGCTAGVCLCTEVILTLCTGSPFFAPSHTPFCKNLEEYDEWFGRAVSPRIWLASRPIRC